jgi:hypothetical protein
MCKFNEAAKYFFDVAQTVSPTSNHVFSQDKLLTPNNPIIRVKM